MKHVVENERKNAIEQQWLKEKIRTTYTRIAPGWRDRKFQYDGWIK